MAAEKLSWENIQKQYDREWVQLINYDWLEENPLPSAGVVRVHAKTRQEFDRLIAEEPQPDSAILFVGERKIPPGVVLSANMHQWKSVE